MVSIGQNIQLRVNIGLHIHYITIIITYVMEIRREVLNKELSLFVIHFAQTV